MTIGLYAHPITGEIKTEQEWQKEFGGFRCLAVTAEQAPKNSDFWRYDEAKIAGIDPMTIGDDEAVSLAQDIINDQLKAAGQADDPHYDLYGPLVRVVECDPEDVGFVWVGTWEDITERMDDGIREDLHSKIAPCEIGEFFEAYKKAHAEKFGEDFEWR